MIIKVKRKLRHPEAPQRNHRAMTRRELIAQGFIAGSATVLSGGILGLFANPRQAYAELAGDLIELKQACGITNGAGKIPFICFDLAGGANMAGSNVLVGGRGGQFDTLSTAGYRKLGLPGNMVPGVPEAAPTATSNGDHTDTSLGLAFHSDSAFLRGIQASLRSPGIESMINGAVIPARSENDTGNNPHNPLYGIQKAGADGSILTLCGSRNTESGGNSVAPLSMIDPQYRPTKIDRPSDVTSLIDTGQLVGLLGPEDATAVLESIYRLSRDKLDRVSTGISGDAVIKDLVKCGYLKAADIADRFGKEVLDPGQDPLIVGPGGIFSAEEFFANNTDGAEFRKTASVMKLVIKGYAGAGCITMGGYDYHGGARQEGEIKDFRAGRCMGACLEYAHRIGVPLMLYVFSDGSLSSNGVIDDSVNGRGKGEWTSDNQDTAASFFLVYNPGGRPALYQNGLDGLPPEQHQQIGWFTPNGDVDRSSSPGANNVNLLVEMVVLNYLALHNEQNRFAEIFGNSLGGAASLDRLIAFEKIVDGTIA
ncbi:MAG: general secretion pathway protein GspF [Gammaproteobacteria bacterium]|nr:general secretion pathway protein GspF [Gammaproteobacteria bacterium]